MVSVPVEDLAGKLHSIRDKFLIPTPDKDYTDYAIMTRCIAALTAAPVREEGGAVDYTALAKIGYETSCNKKWEWASRGCQIGWTDAVKAILTALATREEAPVDPCCPSCEAPAEARGDEIKAAARIIFPESERVKMDREWGGNRNHSRNRWNTALEQARAILALRAQPKAREEVQPALTVWYGSMPESNGKQNWTAILHRKGATGFDIHEDGFCFHRSEYPDRARYEADEMRWIIGELSEKPDLLDCDADAHSGYVAPPPPAPEAEKLRVAVEALGKAETIFAAISRKAPYGHATMSDATHAAVMVRQALAALQQEGR